MKHQLYICILLLLAGNIQADSIPEHIIKRTVEFARKDTNDLRMDIYRLKDAEEVQPVMLFVFGGGFVNGRRDDPFYLKYYQTLAENNITVVAIDYRLGMRGRKITLLNTSSMDIAIDMAVEDLFSATQFLLEHDELLGIDPHCIMASGSSAGAITVLQADYYICNNRPLAGMLPEGFRYQGILSFAGGIFSHKGKPAYKLMPPSPTFFAHGNKDRVVPYTQLRLFKRGIFGAKPIAKRFDKKGYPYYFFTEEGKGHSVSGSPMHDNLDRILWFIDKYVYLQKQWQLNCKQKEIGRPVEAKGNMFEAVTE